MGRRWLGRGANVFVVGYALDAVLSLVDETILAAGGSTGSTGARNALAVLVLYASLLCLPALALFRPLPTLLLAALSLSALWLNSGAAPLPLLFESPGVLGPVAAAIQVAFAAVALLRIRSLNAGRGWLLRVDALRGPTTSLGHSLATVAVGVFLLIPAGVAYVVLSLVTWVQVESSGFVSFDLAGVSLSDRRYERDGQQIRLVGMMHIGEEAVYREIASSFAGESTVVLEEGVSDRLGLLERQLSYGRVAETLGLDQQAGMQEYLEDLESDASRDRPDFRHADVDMSEFAPETVEWLGRVAELWESDDSLAAFAERLGGMAGDEEKWLLVQRDIFELRNRHLLSEIEAALHDYQHLVVPWGAIHLPFIERAIAERGFRPTSATRRRLFYWTRVARALF